MQDYNSLPEHVKQATDIKPMQEQPGQVQGDSFQNRTGPVHPYHLMDKKPNNLIESRSVK